VFSVSVGVGSMLCEKLSGRKVEIGLVPIGALGISVFTIHLWWTCDQALQAFMQAQETVGAIALPANANDAMQTVQAGLKSEPALQASMQADFWNAPLFQRVAADLGLMGLFSGFFIVPLYSYVQLKTPLNETSRVIAANNILNAVFMVGGAGAAAAALSAGLNTHQLLLCAGVLNTLVCLHFFRREPDFFRRCAAWLTRRKDAKG
jgi:hypothetical protein